MTQELPGTTLPPDAPAPKGWGVWMRNKFLAGLALALPLIITFWILYSIYDILHGWSKPVLAQIVNLVNELSEQPLLDINDLRTLAKSRSVSQPLKTLSRQRIEMLDKAGRG